MNTFDKGKSNKTSSRPNPLEALKDLSKSTSSDMKKEAGKLSQDFLDQLLGVKKSKKNYSGEIMAGESIEMNDVMTGKHEEIIRQKRQFEFIANLQAEDKERIEKRTNELRVQMKAIQEEILVISKQTQNLAEEIKVASMQVVVDPGEYHIMFFEKLLEFITSFRKKIDSAETWLRSVNKRASKKNMWGQNYKKKGSSYLLSSEHYLQRSAG
jgi:hypothetical protein